MPGSREHMKKIGKKFGKDLDPSEAGKKGGKAKSFRKYLKENFELELGETFDSTSTFEVIESLLNESKQTLKKISNSDTLPATLTNVASAILKDISLGRIATLESVWDRLYGKALERVESKNTTELKLPKESVLRDDEKLLKLAEHAKRNREDKE